MEKLNQFGAFSTIDTLAQGDILKYDQVLKQPYIIVFNKLMLEKERSEYQDRLRKVHEREAKIKGKSKRG